MSETDWDRIARGEPPPEPEPAPQPAASTVEVGTSTVAEPAPAQRERLGLRLRFKAFRRSRPFWGGLFTMLGGLEIALLAGTAYKLILISHSVSLAVGIGVVLFVLGLFMWTSPRLRKLLGAFALVVAVYSFVGSNFGGFGLGMIFGIIGGSLALAWIPAPLKPSHKQTAEPGAEVEPSAGEASGEVDTSNATGEAAPATIDGPAEPEPGPVGPSTPSPSQPAPEPGAP